MVEGIYTLLFRVKIRESVMKISFVAMFSLISLLCIGCTTVPPNNSNLSFRTESISEPPLNTEVTMAIGDTLIIQGTRVTSKGIVILSDCCDGFVKKGSYQVGFRKSDKIYFRGNGISGNKFMATAYYLEYNLGSGELYYVYTSGAMNVVQPGKTKITSFKYTDISVDSPDAFQRTLIYLGKTGNLLKFGYRETSNGYARPAFSNEISYDLNESNIIGYQKAKLQVIEATNTTIRYKVLSYFD